MIWYSYRVNKMNKNIAPKLIEKLRTMVHRCTRAVCTSHPTDLPSSPQDISPDASLDPSWHEMIRIGHHARVASQSLALLATNTKNAALLAMAQSLRKHAAAILAANSDDMAQAMADSKPAAVLDRLRLTHDRIEAMANSLIQIAALPDPVGNIQARTLRPNGLQIDRISVPIGVIGVIYEARPNVTADAAGLCLKSANAVILRPGKESFASSLAIVAALHEGLRETGIAPYCLQILPSADRVWVQHMLRMDKFIDLMIPRGSMELMNAIATESRIPLLKHLAGLCHTYIHQAADIVMASQIVLNAKMRRTGICGATEVLLLDRDCVDTHLPVIIDVLHRAGCEIRGDDTVAASDRRVKPATLKDYDTEFLAPIIAIKIVADIDAAIAHIAAHGTQHTEAIITQDISAAQKFLQAVDSAIVMHNTSTQFADGGEFGMGAEMGIATGKLHARGPVGLEQLVSFKYLVRGNGQLRG